MMEKKKVIKRIKFGVCLLAVLLLPKGLYAVADEYAEVYIKAVGYKEEEKMVDISCMLKNGEDINNGKIRIHYDSDKITLKESKGGEVFQNAMLEINDCLSGNKEEGELVAAFGASQSIPPSGSLLELKFQLNESVKKGEKITFQIKPEKLSGDNGDVAVKVGEIVYAVGEGVEEGTEEETKEQTDKEETEEKKSEKQKTETDNRDENTKGGITSNSSGGTSPGTKDVKTGDESPTVWYLLGCIGAFSVFTCSMIWKKSKKKS